MKKQLLNSAIPKYRDSSVSRRSIICLSLRLQQVIDLLATDKSRYFAQPRPIIANSMLTIKIPFTINSLKKNYSVKTLFTIPFVKKKKKHLVLIRKIHLIKKQQQFFININNNNNNNNNL